MVGSTAEVETRAVVVAVLSTCHDVDAVGSESMSVLQVGITYDVVLIVTGDAMIAVVVVRERVRADVVALMRVRVL